MGKPKFKRSIFFPDTEVQRFLFKVVNYGKDSDELKFIFDHPDFDKAIIYNKESDKYPEDSIIRHYGELTYHADGSLLWKLPESKKAYKKYVDNPHGTGTRRTPLNAISKWEPIVRGNIIRYKTCQVGLTNDARVLPDKNSIFNGDPFEYYIFLGDMRYQSPPNNKPNELIYRINDVGDNLDLIL